MRFIVDELSKFYMPFYLMILKIPVEAEGVKQNFNILLNSCSELPRLSTIFIDNSYLTIV